MNRLVKLIGGNIKELRKIKNLTQEELAERCGLQVSYLAGVERGERNITLDSLDKIIVGLQVSPSALFLEDNSNKKEINNLLLDRTDKEINLITTIAKEIFKVY